MKAKRIFLSVIFLFIFPCLTLPSGSIAQEPAGTSPASSFSRAQLSQMLAPLALYPDAVLSQILMAATYPIEVIEADRWVRQNEELRGASLDDALQDKDWDPSVKSLCHFPNVLTMMSEKIAETTNLGNAFLAQEDEVMDVVQELRRKAFEQGNLASNQEQKVVVEQQTIIIKPVNPEVIYVPYYNPTYVYGSWWYPDYPPYYWGPADVVIGGGIYFWPTPFFGFAIGSWSFFDWPHHYIGIDTDRRPRFLRHHKWPEKRGRWQHIPEHRRGVAYRDIPTARRFGQAPLRARHFDRGIRGFPERGHPTGRPQVRRKVDARAQSRQQPNRQLSIPAPEKQIRQRIKKQQQIRERTEQTRQPSRRLSVPERQIRQRVEQRRRTVERQEEGNAFSRVEEGREEHQFSTRGRSSRGAERQGRSSRSGDGNSRYQRGRGH